MSKRPVITGGRTTSTKRVRKFRERKVKLDLSSKLTLPVSTSTIHVRTFREREKNNVTI